MMVMHIRDRHDHAGPPGRVTAPVTRTCISPEAKEGLVATSAPALTQYLARRLREVVEPDLKTKTAETYAMHVRLYIVPGLRSARTSTMTEGLVSASISGSKIRSSCCTSLLCDTPKPRSRQPDQGFELRGPEGI
ncbi:hypothetical protein JS756_30350 [Streptomyces actuosus]|uniref:Integrase SAM-like N-terminal domain-containing protein n=1 Tax=Streptomyces actuosus TaxID=1885 RepID=A0ABS2VZ79_STRAS|nr:hypothetical protein [Streptomyces actuosus]MBN0048338.1 hypothetical protein [Streptomyces actuosus]